MYSDPSTLWGPDVFEEYMLNSFIQSTNIWEPTLTEYLERNKIGKIPALTESTNENFFIDILSHFIYKNRGHSSLQI